MGVANEDFINPVEAPEGYTIQTIVNCGVNSAVYLNKFTVYDNVTNLLNGWSHVKDTAEYANLAMAPAEYALANFVSEADPSCNEVQTHDVILVKKYANWDAQHSSGLNSEFLPEDIQFGEVGQIVLEFKIDSEKSTLPTKAEIADAYGEYLTEDELENWDHGKVNLGITLYAADHNDQEIATINGLRIIEVDQAEYADEWVRVTIPGDSLNWYSEQNWARTPLDEGEYEEGTIVGIRINPEVKTEVVLRNLIGDEAWTAMETPPQELFKEMALSIKKVELHLK